MALEAILQPYPRSLIALIRAATPSDEEQIWRLLEPVFRAGETYTVPRDISQADAWAYWSAHGHEVFVFEENGQVLGTYFLRANQRGGGSHVANCGYVTADGARGRGLAGAMCAHSLEVARRAGFRAMQFNFVLSSNGAAVHVWEKHGFAIVGRVPEAFLHPNLGYVDALVMFRAL